MVDGAPRLEEVLPQLEPLLRDRVMVAHNAPFDRRVLRQAFERIGLEWPNPPVICTAAVARAMMPLQRARGLQALARALDIDVRQAHRALPDAETCARVLCALFPRLCANAATIKDALQLLKPKRPPRPKKPERYPAHLRNMPELDFHDLPKDPGVYLFRDSAGRTLYVGKSISIRNRARAHFAPSTLPADWTSHATIVDYRSTRSELGALVLENRLIKQLKPPGNTRLTKRDDRLVYIRCRLDIAFPILEVSKEPAAGHGVTIGPLHGRRLAQELVEQLDSLFGLRHCSRKLPRRDHPSAYGQMGRCLSPCLGDLDPNLYRRRLDEALALFTEGPAGERLLTHVRTEMRRAAAEQRYERAAWLRRRARRLAAILERLEGVLEATHARPRLIVAPHPADDTADAFWIVGGRVRDWGPVPEAAELAERTQIALMRGSARRGELTAHLPPNEVDEMRIVATWLASHPGTPQLPLEPAPSESTLAQFTAGVQRVNGSSMTSAVTPSSPTPHEREPDRAERRRAGGTRDLTDLSIAEEQAVSGCAAAGHPQPPQEAVRLAAVIQPRDRLLADVAPLRERHRALVEACLLRDHRVVQIDAVPRPAVFDPHEFRLLVGQRR
jgi:DNA polymerase-3 subunit epsilon